MPTTCSIVCSKEYVVYFWGFISCFSIGVSDLSDFWIKLLFWRSMYFLGLFNKYVSICLFDFKKIFIPVDVVIFGFFDRDLWMPLSLKNSKKWFLVGVFFNATSHNYICASWVSLICKESCIGYEFYTHKFVSYCRKPNHSFHSAVKSLVLVIKFTLQIAS